MLRQRSEPCAGTDEEQCSRDGDQEPGRHSHREFELAEFRPQIRSRNLGARERHYYAPCCDQHPKARASSVVERSRTVRTKPFEPSSLRPDKTGVSQLTGERSNGPAIGPAHPMSWWASTKQPSGHGVCSSARPGPRHLNGGRSKADAAAVQDRWVFQRRSTMPSDRAPIRGTGSRHNRRLPLRSRWWSDIKASILCVGLGTSRRHEKARRRRAKLLL